MPEAVAPIPAREIDSARERSRRCGNLASCPLEISHWRWGRFIQLEMLHPLGQSGWLRRLPGIGPSDQPGTGSSVKQTARSFGPAMRLVADLGNSDNSLMNVTLGEPGQYASRHCRGQFPARFEGRGPAAPFSDAAQEKARAHRLRLLPASQP